MKVVSLSLFQNILLYKFNAFAFQTVVLETTFESSLDCKEINQSILKEINPEYSLEWLILKMKLQYFGHLMWRVNSGKDPDAG